MPVGRFQKEELQNGNMIIWDTLNPEPVCLVYAKHHPDVPDLILKILHSEGGKSDAKDKGPTETLPQL